MNTPTPELLVDSIVPLIAMRFRTFGGGQDSEWNPLTHVLKDAPLQFAAGVDVRAVVEFILASSRELTARVTEGRR